MSVTNEIGKLIKDNFPSVKVQVGSQVRHPDGGNVITLIVQEPCPATTGLGFKCKGWKYHEGPHHYTEPTEGRGVVFTITEGAA